MTQTKTEPKAKPKQGREPKYAKPHMIIPASDLAWALQQQPSVLKLWNQCWLADPYGSRWVQISTNLSDSAFRAARKVLSDAGLFVFKRETSINDARETVCWMGRNLHGARVKEFWQQEDATQKATAATNKATAATNEAIAATNEAIAATQKAGISPQTTQNQGLPEASVTSQEHLSNSSKEVLRCDENISRAWGASEFSGGEKQPSVRSEVKSSTQPNGQNPNLVGEDKCSAAAESDQKTEIKPGSLAAQILSRMQKWQLDWDSISPEQKHLRIVKRVVEEVFSHRRFPGSDRLERELTAILESLELPLVRLFRHSFLYLQKQRPGAPVIDLINQALSGTGKQIQGADL